MISYSSSFNKLLVFNAIVLVAVVFFSAAVFYPSGQGIDYRLRNRIQREKPDMVLLGSSALKAGIRGESLEERLHFLTGKTYKVIQQTYGVGSRYEYLYFRNQICSSGWRPSVGIVCNQDRLTWYDSRYLATRYMGQLGSRERISDFEPGGKRKLSVGEILREHIFLSRCAEDMAKDLLHHFVTGIFGKFRNDADSPPKSRQAQSYDFDKEMKESLLPRIVALKHKYNIDLFVVVLPTYPQVEKGFSYDQKKQYYAKLEDYLASNGIKYISLWDRKDLNSPDLFLDWKHMNHPAIVQELLARELVAQGIVK